MRGCNKKGLSTIVSTLLILLLVFVAVSLLWVVVRNVIQGGTEQIALGKLTLDLEIKDVTVSGNVLNVRVKRNPGEGTFTGLSFVISDGDNSEVFQVTNVSMSEYAMQTFVLDVQSLGFVASNIKTIEIAPIFTLESGKQVTGDVKDTYALSSGGTSSAENCNNNNIIDVGELCDGINISSGDSCASVLGNTAATGTLSCTSDCSFNTSACSLPTCPNGDLDSGEQCDCGSDGICTLTELNNSGCSDVGNYNGGTLSCSQTSCQFEVSACTYTATCGDGVNETGEQCDDGDLVPGDGCSSTCTIESGYTCTGGNGQSTCTLTPTEICGDGIIQPSNNEVCDCGSDGTCTLTELGGMSCTTLSSGDYTGGTLNCYSSTTCQYDVSGCTGGTVSTDWQTGLVSWWTFDSDASDSVGSNDGTLNGDITHITSGCFSGGCYSFDGINDYISVMDDSSLNPETHDMSFCASFSSRDVLLNRRILSKRDVNYNWYTLYHDSGSFHFSLTDNYTGHGQAFASLGSIQDDTWYQFCGVWDWNQKTATLYLNGGVSTDSGTRTSIDSAISPAAALDIGKSYTSSYFGGLIDEILIWDRALNSTEISNVYNYF